MPFPNFKKPSHILATWFGVGLLRPAPGTWGSLMAAIGWYFLDFLHSWTIIIIPLFVILSLYVCIKADEDSETDDHPSIVIDEVVGMLIALSFVENNFLMYIAAFILFRLFDIWKPGPIAWADINLKGGWGILFDDVLAGLFSGVIIFVFISLI
jgi:phosphatidylglycerophosphatase A|tara:strand:+ start:473 stop:934 length:462 start_codon:yes stop_codon:yes gene_type:complete